MSRLTLICLWTPISAFLVVTLQGTGLCDGDFTGHWRDHAKSYIEHDQRLLEVANDRRDKVLAVMKLRDEAMSRLVNSEIPKTEQLDVLLRSPSVVDRKEALVAALAKKLNDPRLIKTILSLYGEKHDYFVKFYSLLFLNQISQQQVIAYSPHVINIFRNEKDESLIVSGLPILIKLRDDDAVPVLVGYMRNGSNALRKNVGGYLLEKSKTLFDKVQKITVDSGMVEASQILRSVEGPSLPAQLP